jgi:hypothetical protein
LDRVLPGCRKAKEGKKLAEAHNLAVIAAIATSDPDLDEYLREGTRVCGQVYGPSAAIKWLDGWMGDEPEPDSNVVIQAARLRLKLARAAADVIEVGRSQLRLCEALLGQDVDLDTDDLERALRSARKAKRILGDVDPTEAVVARVLELVLLYQLGRSLSKSLALFDRRSLDKPDLAGTKRIFEALIARGFIHGMVSDPEWAGTLANLIRQGIEQASTEGANSKITFPSGEWLSDQRIAHLFGVLDQLAGRADPAVVDPVVKGLQRLRWECEERMGVDRFRLVSRGGLEANARTISRSLADRLPGDPYP